MPKYLSDTVAMQKIFNVLDGQEWNSDTFDDIAMIVKATGRTIREPDDYTDPENIHGLPHPDSPTVGGPGFDDAGYGS